MAPVTREPVRDVANEFRLSVLQHLKAGFPLLYVPTWEELRAEAEVSEAALELKRGLWIWSVTRGWVQEHTGLPLPRGTDAAKRERKQINSTDPLRALQDIHEGKVLPGDTVFVLRDYHFFIENPELIRKLRDMIGFLKSSGRTVIVEAPRIIIPLELEKDITLVPFELPTKDDLGRVLDGVVEAVGESTARVSDRTSLIDGALGLTIAEAENVLALGLVKHGSLGDDAIRSVQRAKADILKKTGILEFFEPDVGMDEIGGLNNLKGYLRKRGKAFTDRARAYGLPASRGIVMLGVQGCGKSACAKAAARMWKKPLIRFDVGRVFGSLVGESEGKMRRALDIVDAIGSCVLWLDELEKGLSGLQSSNFSDGGVTARVFGSLLTWMAERKSAAYVVATCNNIAMLPPELVRKGRFDEIFFVDLPTISELRDIFAIHIRKRGRDPKAFDLEKLAYAAHQGLFSGAEAEEAVISALFEAFDHDEDEVSTAYVLDAIENTKSLAVTMEDQIKATREWAKDRTRPATIEVDDTPKRGRKIDTSGRPGNYL